MQKTSLTKESQRQIYTRIMKMSGWMNTSLILAFIISTIVEYFCRPHYPLVTTYFWIAAVGIDSILLFSYREIKKIRNDTKKNIADFDAARLSETTNQKD